MKKTKAIFAVLFIVITISLLLAYIYGNVQKSERSESFPEFETTSEDIAVHQDSSGEKYTIKRITYINRSPTRSGYRRLNKERLSQAEYRK